jgi:hypothetical protein
LIKISDIGNFGEGRCNWIRPDWARMTDLPDEWLIRLKCCFQPGEQTWKLFPKIDAWLVATVIFDRYFKVSSYQCVGEKLGMKIDAFS